jgi:Nif-specific regulatory protein
MPATFVREDRAIVERLQAEPVSLALATQWLWQAGGQSDEAAFLRDAMAAWLSHVRADYAAVARLEAGRWTVVAEAGTKQPLPVHLVAEALDREEPIMQSGWCAVPLDREHGIARAVVAKVSTTGAWQRNLAALADVLKQAMEQVRQRQSEMRRTRRLEEILRIAATWNQTHEMEPLLKEMAEAATRLLDADRASIFLWDRANKTLVGRPALGVEKGELRIPDNAGVVGQVVHTGQPRRVDLANNQEQIDRTVDTQLGYQTRTLLCVPLRGRSGELFGAFEVINKRQGNFIDEDEAALVELAGHAAIALENTQERMDLLQTRRQLAEQAAAGVRLIGQSPAIEALRQTIQRVAATELAVLILGENGTGKEVVSQSIHYLSPRRDHPFIAVNCAAISETLLESELFGHEKGAFTDAHTARAGKFELASGGTLFLDEIGDLSPSGQAKLLRVLEEKVVVRVGGSTPIATDARVIAATNQNLAEMVRQKRFRQDLYFRLNVVTVELPPLRDRAEDILLLAENFLNEFSRKARRKPPQLSADARRRLEKHTWPGNVRELRNLMERLAYLSPGETIHADDLRFLLAPLGETPDTPSADLPLAAATDEFQMEHIRKAINRTRGNMSEAAEHLGLHRSNLYRKMRQLGMDVQE